MCCMWGPLNKVQKVKLALKAAARILTRVDHRDHIIPVLFCLHWLPTHFWTQSYMAWGQYPSRVYLTTRLIFGGLASGAPTI